MVDIGVMKRNYSKEDFIWILGNLFLATGWLDSWNSLSAQCVNSCTINTFKKYVSV